jgi:site-specific DNA recombinase
MVKDLSVLESFAKGNKEKSHDGITNSVIYTRVSTKGQEDGLSLSTQLKGCDVLALRCKYHVLAYFGGKYESAKTDERKEFNRMLQFIKRSKQKITHIIVYSLDRFSRTGPNAIYLAAKLKEQGITIISVTQQGDASTASGTLQQNIQFLFSQYDNDQRREKCVAGMKERLLEGEAVHQSPVGYDHLFENGKRRIVVNAKGKLIRKAFYWKANDQLSNVQILAKLKLLGLVLYPQQLSKILKNPFYCGMLVHRLLDGKVVEGNHEKTVSVEIFLKVNKIQANNPHGFKHKDDCPEIPLKHFFKCENCGKYLTGYVVLKKGIHYYKCKSGSCHTNQNAESLNLLFKELLSKFTFEEKYTDVIKYQLEFVYSEKNKGNKELAIELKKKLSAVETKNENLEEKYVADGIDKELYQKYSSKYKEEIKVIKKELDEAENKSSNLHEFIDYTIGMSSKLDSYWYNSTFQEKQKLQYLLFPEGIYFNKKTGEVRTTRVNSVFGTIGSLSEELKENKKGQTRKNSGLSPLVEPERFEPPLKNLQIIQ